jgi:hypothetical protein
MTHILLNTNGYIYPWINILIGPRSLFKEHGGSFVENQLCENFMCTIFFSCIDILPQVVALARAMDCFTL